MSRTSLLATIFDSGTHPLGAQLGAWAKASRRFRGFLEAHASKVRKKLRTTTEPEALEDLRLELETAYLLLRERSLSLSFEPLKGGGPDFAVTFTTSIPFLVEVTRLQAAPWGTGREPTPELRAARGTLSQARFDDMLCRKLGQLQPGYANVLIAGVLGTLPDESALAAAMSRLRQRAEANDAKLVLAHGCRGRADFLSRYGRLSALLVRGSSGEVDAPFCLWSNPSAQRPLPGKVRTALVRAHSG